MCMICIENCTPKLIYIYVLKVSVNCLSVLNLQISFKITKNTYIQLIKGLLNVKYKISLKDVVTLICISHYIGNGNNK